MSLNQTWVQQKVELRRVLPFKFNQHFMLFDWRLAVYWVEQETLIVSDLHLEKGSYLSQFANPVPNYDSVATLEKVKQLVEDYQPRCVISLGDSFHDERAFARMDSENKARLNDLTKQVEQWYWILGNHDPELPYELNGSQHEELLVNGVLFCHEPSYQNLPQMIGHYHPKAKRKFQGLSVSGPCLVYSESRLIMPAFGQYTGGLGIDHPVFEEVLNSKQQQPQSNWQGFIVQEETLVPLGHQS